MLRILPEARKNEGFNNFRSGLQTKCRDVPMSGLIQSLSFDERRNNLTGSEARILGLRTGIHPQAHRIDYLIS